MSEWDIFTKMETVKAPPDFEQKVMARLSLRKREGRRRRTVLRWSMAGSFASLAAAAVLFAGIEREKHCTHQGHAGRMVAPTVRHGSKVAFHRPECRLDR